MKLPALASVVAATSLALTTTTHAEETALVKKIEVDFVVTLGHKVIASQRGIGTVYWPGDGNCGDERADAKPFRNGQCHI